MPPIKSNHGLNATGGLLVSLDELVLPSHTVLLVIDMQNDFISPDGYVAEQGTDISKARDILSSVNRLIKEARKTGVQVIYLRTTHNLKTDGRPYMARYAVRNIDVSKPLLCQEGTWGAEFDCKLEPPLPEERIVTKYSYDGFVGTDLDFILRGRSVQTVIPVGVNTNLCVQATSEHAFALGYYLVLPEDCMAGTSDQLHEYSLDNMRRFFGTVVTSQQIIDSWR